MKQRFILFLVLLMIYPLSGQGATVPRPDKGDETIPDELVLLPITESISQVKGMRRLVNDYRYFSTDKLAERVRNFSEVLDWLDEAIEAQAAQRAEEERIQAEEAARRAEDTEGKSQEDGIREEPAGENAEAEPEKEAENPAENPEPGEAETPPEEAKPIIPEKHVPSYLYFAESSRSHPMQFSFPEDSETYLYLRENLHVDASDHLKYSTFEQFCQYYYTTDHHWNFRGSYQAYVDIVRMLKGPEEEVLIPAGVAVFPVRYNGSFCRDLQLDFSREDFAIYLFDPFPAYTAMLNGRRRVYDHIQDYLDNTINQQPLANHYALCYGSNYGKIVLEGNHPGKGNLLIIGDSLGNPVKSLLINHFDKIVDVDLRHYERAVGKPFSLTEVISEYQIDQILFISDTTMYIEAKPMYP